MAEPTNARAAAAALILGVADSGIPISDQITRGALAGFVPHEKARAQRLALATLRNLGRADTVLKPFLRKPPPPLVRAILRLAVVEMMAEAAAPHGVVNAAVDLVRAGGAKSAGFAGMVNAVLRRVAETPAQQWASLPPETLPGWLRGRLMSAWGKAAVQAMEAAHAAGAPLDLTPRRGDSAGLAAHLGGAALPTGSIRLINAGQVSELSGYDAGDWWVQDAGAALAARVLAARPGEQVLDLCAAPGGKTLQLASAGTDVTALDQSAARMARLRENLKRCRLTARTVVADALTWQTDQRFNAILLDAPCSATGTIRRHPDLPHCRDPAALKALAALQSALIDKALTLLQPGGRLVYCTCSLLPDEGERQVSAALARHAGLAADAESLRLPGVEDHWISTENALRTRPDHWSEIGGIDGFFIACLGFG
ncbi:MAG: methyltransferase [Rhodobacteraceae bacterium]|nr:methyltransferase [Paracoccaceae bacterium]MCP5341265.1 methyltransferase [Paracoccaceae bacterium]